MVIRDYWNAEDIEFIIERQRILYQKEYGFDATFGDYVAASFQGKIERLWISEKDGAFAGCIGM